MAAGGLAAFLSGLCLDVIRKGRWGADRFAGAPAKRKERDC